jgi:hypothetical protein
MINADRKKAEQAQSGRERPLSLREQLMQTIKARQKRGG